MGEDSLQGLRAERTALQELLLLEPGRRRLWRRPNASGADSPEHRGFMGTRAALRDPELRKNLEILAADISDAIDLDRRATVDEKARKRFLELAQEPRKALTLETVLDARRSFEKLLAECGDRRLLQQRTAAEYAEDDATLPTWKDSYGADVPAILTDASADSAATTDAAKAQDDDEELTRTRLEQLVEARFSLYRPLRARRRLRITYLRDVIAPAVLVTGVLFALAIAFHDDVATRAVLLAAAAGAAGASLSGLLKFRDEMKLGSQVRDFWPFYLAQVLVGAVFGLLILLLAAAGWVDVDEDGAAMGAVAFAAGFSEPFAVGVVAKLGERASR
jgi:hypothetical protein